MFGTYRFIMIKKDHNNGTIRPSSVVDDDSHVSTSHRLKRDRKTGDSEIPAGRPSVSGDSAG